MADVPTKEELWRKLEEQQQGMLREYTALKRLAVLSQERAAGAERQLSVLQTRTRDVERPQTESMEAKMQHLLQQNERLNAQIVALRNEITTMTRDTTKHKSRISELEVLLASVTNSKSTLEVQRQRDEEQIRSLRASIRILETEHLWIGQRTKGIMKKQANVAEGGSDGSFMHIDVAPAVKLVIFSCIGSVLFALFVLVGFGNSPAVAIFESTSNETRCTSAFTLEQFDECSGESFTNSAGFGSLAAVDELLRLNESEQVTVLGCMLDQCDTTSNTSSYIEKEEELLVAEFSFELNNLFPRNRYFYVEMLFPNDEPDSNHYFAVTITANMKGIYENETTGGNSTVEVSPSVRQETVNITCLQDETYCEPHFMLRFNNIDYENYQVGILLNSTEDLPINGSSVTFRLAAGSPKFTNWMLGMKIFFLLVSTAVAVKYNLSLNALSIREQNLEQTWVSILSVTLVFYNDPFFVVEASYGGNALKILGLAFQVTFLQFVLLFWLLAFDNLRLSGLENGVSNERFFIPKAFFIGWFWVFNFVYFGYMKYHSNNDSVWDPLAKNNTFALAQSLMVIMCFVYVLWFAYLLLACLPELRAKPARHRYLMFLTCYVFLVWLSAIGSSAISPVPLSGGSWTACLALFNIYIYALAYLYAPSAKTIAQAKQRQAMHGNRAEPEARPVLQPTTNYAEAMDGDDVDIEDVNLA